MNPNEIRTIIDEMDANWPSHDWKEGESAHGQSRLRGMELDDAMLIVEKLANSEEFFPSWARLHAQLYWVKVPTIEPDLEADAMPTEQARYNAKRIIVMQRAALAYVATLGEHRHNGPTPCRVCGGMWPDIDTRTKAEKRRDVEAIQRDIGDVANAAGEAFHASQRGGS